MTLTTRNPVGAVVITAGAEGVEVTGPVGPPVTVPLDPLVPPDPLVLPAPAVVVLDGMMIVYVPTGGGPYSARAAWTMATADVPSDRVVSGRPPRYMPSAEATSAEEYPRSLRPAVTACAHAAFEA